MGYKQNVFKKPSTRDEYYFLTSILGDVQDQINGECADVDCNKYLHLDCMKKSKTVTVLDHGFSCIPQLMREKKILERLLSQNKYARYRYKTCSVCRKQLDLLDETTTLSSFVALNPSGTGKLKGREWISVQTHKACSAKVKTPKDFRKF